MTTSRSQSEDKGTTEEELRGSAKEERLNTRHEHQGNKGADKLYYSHELQL